MKLIDADKMRDDWLENGENEFVYDTNAVLESIDAQPTVDAALVVHGRWNPKPIYKANGNGGVYKYCDLYFCSECATERPFVPPFNYCPNCGAKMDGDPDV